jgi:hypothetical protein
MEESSKEPPMSDRLENIDELLEAGEGWLPMTTAPKGDTVVELRSIYKANPATFRAERMLLRSCAFVWVPVPGQKVGIMHWAENEVAAWRPTNSNSAAQDATTA